MSYPDFTISYSVTMSYSDVTMSYSDVTILNKPSYFNGDAGSISTNAGVWGVWGTRVCRGARGVRGTKGCTGTRSREYAGVQGVSGVRGDAAGGFNLSLILNYVIVGSGICTYRNLIVCRIADAICLLALNDIMDIAHVQSPGILGLRNRVMGWGGG